jgi:hypothetical protein
MMISMAELVWAPGLRGEPNMKQLHLVGVVLAVAVQVCVPRRLREPTKRPQQRDKDGDHQPQARIHGRVCPNVTTTFLIVSLFSESTENDSSVLSI